MLPFQPVLLSLSVLSYFPGNQGDETRAVMRFKPVVAPTKATVFPLVQKAALNELAVKISRELTSAGLSSIIDTTGEVFIQDL